VIIMSDLSSPLRLGPLTVKNRIVMPPMVLFKDKTQSWEPDADHVEYYARRARAGTGLVIVEATAVAPEGRLAPFQLRAWDDEQIPGLAKIAGAIKDNGAAAMIQIHHAGANTRSKYIGCGELVSPSGVPADPRRGEPARALTTEEIEGLIAAYATAARRCVQAGFDGVELHGAHGYLLSQFLSPAYNRRTDAWGGAAIGGRLAFPLAVTKAVREAIGDRVALGYRLGAAEYFSGGLPHAEGVEAARLLAETGALDVLHISNGMGGGDWPQPPEGFGFSQLLWLGARVKKIVRIPVIAVGGIRTGREAREALERDLADAIAVGRAMLADPEWSAKALNGRDEAILLCRGCQRCGYFTPRGRCAAV
jgi:2,4-dienoyl-CoA reductase-like NADH-dependent reductase (Old Yellow Enzyme family)